MDEVTWHLEGASAQHVIDVVQYFEAVLKSNGRNIDAMFGKAKHLEMNTQFDEANQVLSTLVVVYPKFDETDEWFD